MTEAMNSPYRSIQEACTCLNTLQRKMLKDIDYMEGTLHSNPKDLQRVLNEELEKYSLADTEEARRLCRETSLLSETVHQLNRETMYRNSERTELLNAVSKCSNTEVIRNITLTHNDRTAHFDYILIDEYGLWIIDRLSSAEPGIITENRRGDLYRKGHPEEQICSRHILRDKREILDGVLSDIYGSVQQLPVSMSLLVPQNLRFEKKPDTPKLPLLFTSAIGSSVASHVAYCRSRTKLLCDFQVRHLAEELEQRSEPAPCSFCFDPARLTEDFGSILQKMKDVQTQQEHSGNLPEPPKAAGSFHLFGFLKNLFTAAA